MTTEWEIETDDEAHFFARDPRTGVAAPEVLAAIRKWLEE